MSWLLPLPVFLLLLPLPSVLCANLLCYYSPIEMKEVKVELIVTECPPDELCFKADGRYGNYSALTARGCMARADCSQVHKHRFRGTVYSMSYSCCDTRYCNSGSRLSAGLLSIMLSLVGAAVIVFYM